MNLILLGAPGAGKGTQATVLCEKAGVPHISTGDIFRENIKNNTQLGIEAKKYMDAGALVPDELTIQIVKDRLQKDDCAKGFVLDGFPRTIPQAEMLDAELKAQGIAIDAVINIDVKDDVIIKRMSGRRTCSKCSTPYHTIYNKPKQEGICDACGGELVQRADDKEETVKNRLETYHEQTEPLIKYYGDQDKVIDFDGQKDIDEISQDIFNALGL